MTPQPNIPNRIIGFLIFRESFAKTNDKNEQKRERVKKGRQKEKRGLKIQFASNSQGGNKVECRQ